MYTEKYFMEQDIQQKAGSYLKSLQESSTISSEVKDVVEKWLSQQIQQERQQWKKKLQLSLQEVERERRNALDLFHHIQLLNEKLEDDIKNILIATGDELYLVNNCAKTDFLAYDRDAREDMISKIKHNIGLLLYELEILLNDRKRCLRYLGMYNNPETNGNNNNGYINTDQQTVLACLKKKFRLLEQKYQVTKRQLDDEDGKLKRDVGLLRESMIAYESSNTQHQQKYATELAVILAVLTKRIERHDRTRDCCLQVCKMA